MILYDLQLYGYTGNFHLHIKKGLVKKITQSRSAFDDVKEDYRYEMNGSLALPGFVNSHDHLDFNCFAAAGHGVYPGYREWAYDVQEKDKKEFEKILRIPEALRVKWGEYKNLLNGFTTVVNHGKKLSLKKPVIHVCQSCKSLHSVAFEKHWREKLNATNQPVVMHIGEGTTGIYKDEIDEVIAEKKPGTRLIAVHGVALTTEQARSLSGLTWCPASNFFLLGKTANMDVLQDIVPVLFGTDSTLSAGWNAWEHFRMALQTNMVTPDALVGMLTSQAATVWKLHDKGMIREHAVADLLIIPTTESIFQSNPQDIEMVIQDGKIRLAGKKIIAQKGNQLPGKMSVIHVNGELKMVTGDLPALLRKIKKWAPGFSPGWFEA